MKRIDRIPLPPQQLRIEGKATCQTRQKIFAEIGYDLKQDKKRFFVDKESGIIVIPKGYKFS